LSKDCPNGKNIKINISIHNELLRRAKNGACAIKMMSLPHIVAPKLFGCHVLTKLNKPNK